MTQQQKTKIEWIQSLRAVAAIYVMLFHCIPFWNLIDNQTLVSSLSLLSKHGYIGVDIFFVISGYVIGLTTLNKQPTLVNGMHFIKTRLLRIYLGYWPALLFTLILAYVGIRPLVNIKERLFDSIFLLSKQLDGNLLEVAWSLSFELTFYLMAFVCIFLLKQVSIKKWILLLIAIHIGYNAYWYVFHNNIIIGGVWPLRNTFNAMTVEFLLGLYLATFNQSFFKHKELMPFFIIVGILTFMAGTFSMMFVNYEFLRVCTFGMFGVAITLVCLMLENNGFRSSKLLNQIGDASYSLYLTHPLLLACIGAVLPYFSSGTLKSMAIIMIPFACIVFSLLWYRFIERPLYTKVKQYF